MARSVGCDDQAVFGQLKSELCRSDLRSHSAKDATGTGCSHFGFVGLV
jgi:hypothetical protein